MSEQIVLDPLEVSPGRSELTLDDGTGGGVIRVRADGVDWGDAEIAAYMAETSRGEMAVDYRIPNRHPEIPLVIRGSTAAAFNTARSQLQQKVGLFQREGGRLKRTLGDGSVVYLDIVNATLHLSGGWSQAHTSIDAEATLSLEALPDFYGAEQTLGLHTETTAAELVFTEADIAGDYPARVVIEVSNDDATHDQLGLLWAFRSRRYDAAASAASAYEAEVLTPLDQAVTSALSGASGSGNNTIRHPGLSTSWTPVLSTNLLDGTYLTHQGTYRLFARVLSLNGSAVSLRAVWDVGDLLSATENDSWTFPGSGDWYIADLGELRLYPTPIAPHRWQAQIQAKGATGGETVRIDKLWLVCVDEGMGRLSAPYVASQSIPNLIAHDEFGQTSGNLNTKTLPQGGTWQESTAGKFTLDTANYMAQHTGGSTDYAVISGSSGTEQTIQADTAPYSLGDGTAHGVVLRYTDTSNYLAAYISISFVSGPRGESGSYYGNLKVVKVKAGTPTTLYDSGQIAAYGAINTFWTLRLRAAADGSWQIYIAAKGSTLSSPSAAGTDTDLATGGTLASGKAGLYSSGAADRFDNVQVWGAPTVTSASRDAVAFASQDVHIRHDGCYRLDPAGNAFGPVPILRGDLPRLPPSGLEGRPCEVFLKLSRGDLDQLPDSGIDDLSAVVRYRPSYLFIAES